eukprot:jgi/Psemu1/27953/gm1.27953_g
MQTLTPMMLTSTAPKNFIPPTAKSALGEPPWSMVGNPGLWDQYCFRPKFNQKKEGKFLHQKLQSGYNKPCYSRRYVLPSMVDSELLFPSERKGLLNMRTLKLHGLTRERLILGDALFFYQLLLPLHLDPVDEAEEDPLSKRKPFYSEVSRWSSNYANHDHTVKVHYVGRITLKDVVRFDGIVFLHGALDGRKQNICYRWVHLDALYSHQDMSTFNYAYKFDYIYEVLVHNTRYFTEKAGDYLCMDESSWPDYGFGGPMLWKRHPHLTADNFFNGDSILDWMGERELGIIGTVARNKLPKGVPHQYFHKENASHSSGKLPRAYRRVHHSFQSTGSCNLGSVNSLSTKSFFLHRKERGRDNDESSISRANIGYKSWKYYHSAVNHAKALSIATAYDVYKEFTHGTRPNWSIEKPMDYQVFRHKLAEQMLHFDPKNKLYPADDLLRENTQMSKHQWSRADRSQCCSYTTDHGLVLNYHSHGTVFKLKGAGRFCFSSIEMEQNLASFKSTKWHSGRLCYACGKPCYYVTQTRFRVILESPRAYLGRTPLKAKKKLKDVTQQLGLTNTCNGPQSSDGALPEVLDNQVMYDPSVKPIGRALIGRELKNLEDDDDSVSDDNLFFPNNDDEEEGSESIDAPHSLSVNDEEGINIDVDDSHCDSNTLVITTPNVGRNISDKLKVKIKLMKIMWNHSIPLVAEKELASVMKEISAPVPEIKGNGFEPHLIDWCSKKSQNADVSSRKQIYVQPFQKVLHSLLMNVTLVKEDNLSFPHAEDPTLPVCHPELQGNIDIDGLHHGEWWINTWEKRCKSKSNEILVPIILYMDGIAIDNSGQTTLTPLNMTLGIFNTLVTRNSRLDAWEAIYYHPTCPGDKGAKSIDNVNNPISGLRLALSSLKDACNQPD